MNPTKALIAEAVSRFPLQSSAFLADLAAKNGTVEIDRIETDKQSISTIDCFFDGTATIVLKDARSLQALVFGRFDGRRAEVERILIAA